MNVVVISAHPDDETIGCGGTLLKHLAKKDSLYWIIVTDMFENHIYSKERVEARKSEIDRVSEAFSFKKVFKLGYETMKLDSSSIITMVPEIQRIFNEIHPEVFYIMNRSDAHSDHRIVFEAGISCTKSFRTPSIKKVLMYECISETEFAPSLHENVFIPNYFVDISDHFEKKIEIARLYEGEIFEHPFPRSLKNIEALATYRGAVAGVQYAEAFQLLKYYDK